MCQTHLFSGVLCSLSDPQSLQCDAGWCKNPKSTQQEAEQPGPLGSLAKLKRQCVFHVQAGEPPPPPPPPCYGRELGKGAEPKVHDFSTKN